MMCDQNKSNQVEVFKTNVTCPTTADLIIKELATLLPQSSINFDLEDCDKILRVESRGQAIDVYLIIQLVRNLKLDIAILE